MNFEEYLQRYSDTLDDAKLVMEKAEKIAEMYCDWEVPACYEPRAGTALWGVTSADISHDSPLSVAAHERLVYVLVDAVESHFPDLLSEKEWKEVKAAAIYHDVAEVIIHDIPDDGSPEHEKKYETEYINIEAFFSLFGDDRSGILELIKAKDEARKSNAENWKFRCSWRAARMLHMADKASAILVLSWHEMHGRNGNLVARSDGSQPSESDLEAVEATGDMRPLANWTYKLVPSSNLRIGEDIDAAIEAILRKSIGFARADEAYRGMPWLDEALERAGWTV